VIGFCGCCDYDIQFFLVITPPGTFNAAQNILQP